MIFECLFVRVRAPDAARDGVVAKRRDRERERRESREKRAERREKREERRRCGCEAERRETLVCASGVPEAHTIVTDVTDSN